MMTGWAECWPSCPRRDRTKSLPKLLDLMVDDGILTEREAADGLERMIGKGVRLPQEEIDERLKYWRVA